MFVQTKFYIIIDKNMWGIGFLFSNFYNVMPTIRSCGNNLDFNWNFSNYL